MHNVQHILDDKGHEIISVAPDEMVIEAVKRMAEKSIGALLVLADGEVKGMFSERDYARKVILAGRASRETRVEEVMTSPVITISPLLTAAEGLELMTRKRIRHLPVIDEGKLVGMVSIGDLVNAVIDDQRVLIEQLEAYVRG
ncbi:MAG: CBS domain-containing protein [Wenzhouxiangella sp.]|nr:CBS domain-containing protein [Wenzhouxiangella sp.]MCH8477168.1 CBS domain-containing protein [Wenzhouxiangella sp.]TVR97164.1 MAG: CBS domain-containing protein [Wenzhouxiangellaceae bacterium]